MPSFVLALDPDAAFGLTVIDYRGAPVALVPIALSSAGLDQLTGDVLAGPGSGSVSAEVVGLRGLPLPSPPGTGSTVLTDNAGVLAWDAAGVPGITELTGDVLAGPGSGSQAATVVSSQSLAGSGSVIAGADNAGSFAPLTDVSSFVTLGGDVAGPAGANTLENIQGLPLPPPPSTGTTVLGDTAGVLGWVAPGSLVSSGLIMPGTVTAPPTVAGGGWTFVNNSPGTTTATDQPNGTIVFEVPNGAANGNGYVRAGSNSATMSVEMAASMMGPFATVSGGTQAVFYGVEMVEESTGDYLAMYVESGCEAVSGSSPAILALYFKGTHVAGQQSFGNVATYGQPFVRLRLSGANVLGEVSVDKQTWQAVFSSPITTAFSAVPSGGNPYQVGLGFYGPASFNGNAYVTLFDFNTT